MVNKKTSTRNHCIIINDLTDKADQASISACDASVASATRSEALPLTEFLSGTVQSLHDQFATMETLTAKISEIESNQI